MVPVVTIFLRRDRPVFGVVFVLLFPQKRCCKGVAGCVLTSGGGGVVFRAMIRVGRFSCCLVLFCLAFPFFCEARRRHYCTAAMVPPSVGENTGDAFMAGEGEGEREGGV